MRRIWLLTEQSRVSRGCRGSCRAQQAIGLDIELRKRIPMGAGLGGGSSDAAATIIGLNRLFQLGWSQAQMADVGQSFGSDVPFFLFSPSAVVTGRGETVGPSR